MNPEALLRWHRRQIARYWTQPSGDADADHPPRFVVSSSVWATNNPTWGYRRIAGKLAGLGCRSSPILGDPSRSATDGCCPHSTLKREEPEMYRGDPGAIRGHDAKLLRLRASGASSAMPTAGVSTEMSGATIPWSRGHIRRVSERRWPMCDLYRSCWKLNEVRGRDIRLRLNRSRWRQP